MEFVNAPIYWSPTPTVMYKRQDSSSVSGTSTSNTSSSTQPPSTSGSGSTGGQAPPLSVFTFIIAIALFVLVVTFVLLRIFVRNRRLRRLGLYPESPIERLLGGPIREYEDTLPPPRIWDAKIADIGTNNQLKSGYLGGGVGSGEGKDYGWDTLMPVAAALPPSLYPVIFAQDASNNASSNNANTNNANGSANPHSPTSRIGVRIPNFLRRSTNEQTHDANTNTNTEANTANQSNDVSKTNSEKDQSSSTNKDEKLNASVNITVLIAMPSPSTIFPAMQKNLRHSSSKPNSNISIIPTSTKLPEVEEDVDVDALSDKGKARRAPSLRSVRSTATIKSLGEARREAFFSLGDSSNEEQQKKSTSPVEATQGFYDDEEEALPELVFGTASVPLYSKILSRKQAVASSPTLISPSRDEIMSLMASVSEARSKKVNLIAKEQSDQKSDDAEGNRRSVAGTSLEGGMSNLDDQQGLGDVVTRMMRDQSARDQNESYELRNIGQTAGTSRPNLESQTSTATQQGLMTGAASMGLDEQATPLATPMTATERDPLRLASTPSLQTPGFATDLPPLSSVGSTTTIFTDAHEPQSTNSIHSATHESEHSFHSTH